MPPLLQPSSEHTTAFDGHQFTHDDVRVLFDIVAAAEQSPRANFQPYSALFHAYEETLARHGLKTELDQIYFRVLFRIGELHGDAHSLHEALDRFLQERGIVLELGSDGPDDMSYSADAEEAVEETEDAPAAPAVVPARRRPRRASFDTFADTEEQGPRPQRGRADSTASLSRLQDHSEGFGSRPFKRLESRSTKKGKEPAIEDREERLMGVARGMSQPGENIRRPANRHDQYAQKSKPARGSQGLPSDLGHVGRGVRRTGAAATFAIYEDPNSAEERGSAPVEPTEDSIPDFQHQFLRRPSESQLVRDAETFDHFRVRNLTRNVLRHWGIRTDREHARHEQWLLDAVWYDKKALMLQTLDAWWALLQARQQGREEERRAQELRDFYDSLEIRADQVYNVSLLSKAISHWAQCAAEEVENKKSEQGHILRFRYFNAWKEITCLNELKIRQHVLRRFLALWRRQLYQSTAAAQRALVLYQDSVVETIHKRWFWTVCERRIEAWRNTRLKQLHLVRWGLRLRQNLSRSLRVCNLRDDENQRRCFTVWQQKAKVAGLALQQAADFRQRRLIARCLPQWERQLRHAPTARLVQGMVQWRIVSSTFSTMHLRLQHALQAELVNRRRIARNAWTLWNDRLRWQTLLRQVDDRFATHALYRWVIAERLTLMTRLCEERTRVRAFGMLLQRWQELKEQREEAVKAAGRLRDRGLLRDALTEWTSKLLQRRHQDAMALEFCAPRLQQNAMRSWHAAHDYVIQLDRWSGRAVHYFRANRTLKALQSAVSESRKQKRRDAYVQVRRRLKMNLARTWLLRWHEKASSAVNLSDRGNELVRQRQLETKFSIVNLWRERLSQARQNLHLVEEQDEYRLLALALGQWTRRLRDAERDAQAASNFARSHQEKSAFDCLRRLQLRSLEHQALAAKASTVYSWSDRRRLRALVRGWADHVAEKRTGRKPAPQNPGVAARRGRDQRRNSPYTAPGQNVLATVSPPAPPFSPPPSNPSIMTGNHSPLQELTQAIPLPTFAAVTPLPGYLSTPSKRAERARALVPFGPESLRSVGRRSVVESFTPATGGLRTLRRSVLGRNVPATAARNAPEDGTIFEDQEQGPQQGEDGVGVGNARLTSVNDASGTNHPRAGEGVRRSLFSSGAGS